VGLIDRSRSYTAIAIREDGRRVPVRMPTPFAVTLLSKLELLVLGLVALIPGSRREPGGRRRLNAASNGATSNPRTLAGGEGLLFVSSSASAPEGTPA
jgi:hypothetical protein